MTRFEPVAHAELYSGRYSAAEHERFTREFGVITEAFKEQFLDGVSPADPRVKALVEQHYRFCLQFWTPNRESYVALATSYLLPTPYRDSYENLATGLAKYHYDALVLWANQNL